LKSQDNEDSTEEHQLRPDESLTSVHCSQSVTAEGPVTPVTINRTQ